MYTVTIAVAFMLSAERDVLSPRVLTIGPWSHRHDFQPLVGSCVLIRLEFPSMGHGPLRTCASNDIQPRQHWSRSSRRLPP